MEATSSRDPRRPHVYNWDKWGSGVFDGAWRHGAYPPRFHQTAAEDVLVRLCNRKDAVLGKIQGDARKTVVYHRNIARLNSCDPQRRVVWQTPRSLLRGAHLERPLGGPVPGGDHAVPEDELLAVEVVLCEPGAPADAGLRSSLVGPPYVPDPALASEVATALCQLPQTTKDQIHCFYFSGVLPAAAEFVDLDTDAIELFFSFVAECPNASHFSICGYGFDEACSRALVDGLKRTKIKYLRVSDLGPISERALSILADFLESPSSPVISLMMITVATPDQVYPLCRVLRRNPRFRVLQFNFEGMHRGGVLHYPLSHEDFVRFVTCELNHRCMILGTENVIRTLEIRKRQLRRRFRGCARAAGILLVKYRDMFVPGGPGFVRAKEDFEARAAGVMPRIADTISR